MDRHLRLRVRLNVGEPAHSIMARLATRHGAEMQSFSRHLRLDLRDLACGHGIDRLSALVRADGQIIKIATVQESGVGHGVRFHGEDLTSIDWKIHPRRVCVVCMSADREQSHCEGLENCAAWHRSWWDVRCIQICPIHGCLLSCSCSECGEILRWSGSALDRCPQGHLLAVPAVMNLLDPTVDRYLLDRILNLEGKRRHPFLDQFSLGNAARIVERLGEAELGGWAHRYTRNHEGAVKIRHRIAGFQMTSDIERRFRSTLDKVSHQAPEGPKGLVHSYGWIYRSWLGVPGCDQSGGKLLSILLDHAAENGIISERELEPSASGLSLKAASIALQMSSSTTRRVVQARKLVPFGSRPGVAFHIDGSSVEGIRRQLADLVDCQTAAKMLGIGRNQFRSLVRERLIHQVKEVQDLGLGQRFSIHDLKSFLNKLRCCAVHRNRDRTELVPLSTACRTTGVSLADACAAILAGKLVPSVRGADVRGIASITVMIDDMRSLMRPRSQPVTTVAMALGIHPQAASGLLKTGAFGDPPDVSMQSISDFRSKYVKPADLVSRSKRSGRAVIRCLSEANLRPAFGPPQCRQFFYPRQAATRKLRAADTARFK